jgi:hypothetical protein
VFLDKLIRHGFVKHLAALSVGLSSCPAAAFDLDDLPQDVFEDILDDVGDAQWRDTDRRIALLLAVEDARVAVRLRAAHRAPSSGLDLDDLEPFLLRLAEDSDPAVREATAQSLAVLLGGADGLERTAVIGDWSTSASPAARLALARALARPFAAVGARAAIEQLALDPVAEVRRAAVAAARARCDRDPDLLAAVVSRQIADLDLDTADRASDDDGEQG